MAEVSEAAVQLVAHFEGFKSRAYLDVAGVPTIGYGSTRIDGMAVFMGQSINIERARTALIVGLNEAAAEVERALPGVELRQWQLDALASFVYNVGAGSFRTSTLRRVVQADSYSTQVAAELARWNKASVVQRNERGEVVRDAAGRVVRKKVAVAGLTRRRAAEAHLYLTGEVELAEA